MGTHMLATQTQVNQMCPFHLEEFGRLRDPAMGKFLMGMVETSTVLENRILQSCFCICLTDSVMYPHFLEPIELTIGVSLSIANWRKVCLSGIIYTCRYDGCIGTT